MIIGQKVTNPGELRTKVTLQKRVVTTNAGGFQIETPTTIAQVWAKWVNAHGSEVWASQAVNALQAAEVTIRYRNDVDTTCYVLLGSDLYEITAVDNVSARGEYLVLSVQANQAG